MLRWTLLAFFCAACEPPPETASRPASLHQGAPGGPGAPPAPGGGTGAPAAHQGLPAAKAPASSGGGLRCDTTPFWSEVFGRELAEPRVVEGSIDWPEEVQAAVLIDLVDPASLRPLYGVECLGSGSFRLEVPASLPSFLPLVFLDRAGDGPTPDDPQGRGDVVAPGGSVAGLAVTLRTDAPLEGLRPAAPMLPAGARLPPPSDDAP